VKRGIALLSLALATACSGGGAEAQAPAPDRAEAEQAQAQIPAGYGRLKQDEASIRLRTGPLLLKVTPLAASVIRLTAPDPYTRLHGLATTRREEAASKTRESDPSLFLVSFFSYDKDVTYQPEDVWLFQQGRLMQPLALLPVTPEWGRQQLQQQGLQFAVYAYEGGIDLEIPLSLEYEGVRSDSWESTIRTLQEERARVRSRAEAERESGGGGR
jgi:hypothetical protein